MGNASQKFAPGGSPVGSVKHLQAAAVPPLDADSAQRLSIRSLTDDDLVRLAASIRAGDVFVQNFVMQHLEAMSLSEETKPLVLYNGGVELLSAIAVYGGLDLQKQAAASFAQLATTDEARLALVAQDSVQPIMALCRSRDEDVRVWAVWTLASLAESDDNRLPLARENVLPVMYELARDPDVRIKSYIAAALANLAKRDEVRAMITQSGGTTVIVELARCFEIRVQSYAAAALANLTAKEDYRRVVIDSGGLAALALLARSVDSSVHCFAAAAFANLAKSAGFHARILDEVGMGMLVRLLQADDVETQCFAASAISNLAKNEALRGAVGGEGCVDALVTLLSSPHEKSRRYATTALQYLARSESVLERLVRVGGDNILVQLKLRGSSSSGGGGAGPRDPSPRTDGGDGLTKVLLETQRLLEQKNQELLKVTMRFAESQMKTSREKSPGRSPDDPDLKPPYKAAAPPPPQEGHRPGECVPVAEVERLKQQLELSSREENKIKQQYETAYRQLLAAQKDLESLAREHALMTAELGDAKRSLAVATSRAAAQTATIESLEAQLASRPAVDQSAELRLRDARIAELQQRLSAAQAQAEHAMTEAARAQETRKDTVEEVRRVRAEAQTEIDRLRAELERTRDDLRRTREELEVRRAEIGRLHAEHGSMTELKARVRELEAKAQSAYADGLAAGRAENTAQLRQMDDINRLYRKELAERKALYNRLQEILGNIRVYCRVRPLSDAERAEGLEPTTQFPSEDAISLFDPEKMSTKLFSFDRVYSDRATQEQVFEDTQPLITSVLDGYHVCIFAYGQTGSGKTYTMEGPPGDPYVNPGVNLRALQELFRLRDERAGEYDIQISVSMVEIYNEQIRDLLGDPRRKMDLKQRPGSTAMYLPDAVERVVRSTDEVATIMRIGRENRATGVTQMNEHSSRSHLVVVINVVSVNRVSQTTYTGKLNLVDLAGSERLSTSGAEGTQMAEAISINKSLSALGDVIFALANKAAHVPYRNSKLTHMLSESLSQDSKALMFVQVSPNPRHLGESVCSLNFANRVRTVELGPAKKLAASAAARAPAPALASRPSVGRGASR